MKKGYSQNFSLFQYFVYKLCMIMCIDITPTALNKFSDTRIYGKNCSYFTLKLYLLNSFGEMCF